MRIARIPAGTRDGQTLRLRGKGQPGLRGGEPGDALIEIAVRPHRFFVRDGDDIRMDLPITVREAVSGPSGIGYPDWTHRAFLR
jgi:DnaJ-class molecular chaperone